MTPHPCDITKSATLPAGGGCASQLLISHSLVSRTSRHTRLSLVSRLETPIPQVEEHSVQLVVTGKQVLSTAAPAGTSSLGGVSTSVDSN